LRTKSGLRDVYGILVAELKPTFVITTVLKRTLGGLA